MLIRMQKKINKISTYVIDHSIALRAPNVNIPPWRWVLLNKEGILQRPQRLIRLLLLHCRLLRIVVDVIDYFSGKIS